MAKSKSFKKRDLHQEITDKIVKAIENGIGNKSWEKPWNMTMGDHVNLVSKNRYNGVNILSLSIDASEKGFSSNIWATYKQWKSKGCQVRKGQKGTMIVFFKEIFLSEDKRKDENDDGRRFIIRSSTVFNAEQVDGFEADETPKPENVIFKKEKADRIIKHSKADIRHGGDRAFFKPSNDYIQIPNKEYFIPTKNNTAEENYYATLLHELTHWTGHKNRLARDLSGGFGTKSYAFEELVAELGSAFLCAELGVTNETREDHIAYLASWLQVLKNDKKAIFKASRLAQEAVKLLQEKL